MFAAFVLTYLLYGHGGVRRLFLRQVGRGAPYRWVLVGALLPFAFFVAAVVVSGLATSRWVDLSQLGSSDSHPGVTFLGFALIQVLCFGFGEETGWRGFALPRLQDKLNPLIAAVAITVPWALWHIPAFFYNENMMTMGVAGSVGWLTSLVTGSVILSWLFNNSRGSILPVALFHGLLDVVFVSQVVSGNLENYVGAIITVFSIVIMFVVWKSKNKVTTAQVA
ncbi:hypothetical protein AZH51_07780 [Branchiibius sp. NY16-3462-2]|nr:hypothetical protein AZH51_07780 [Branchiibius sp. NY16-3462-2]